MHDSWVHNHDIAKPVSSENKRFLGFAFEQVVCGFSYSFDLVTQFVIQFFELVQMLTEGNFVWLYNILLAFETLPQEWVKASIRIYLVLE